MPIAPLFVHLASVFLLVCVLCRPVCWTSLHPFDFIRNLFTGLYIFKVLNNHIIDASGAIVESPCETEENTSSICVIFNE